MQKPLVSIILPTFNGERWLQDSIDSCLNQTWRNLELVIVDDGSSNPRTREILDAQSDERVRLLRLGKNGGLPNALNEGHRAARGALLTWTSDDNAYRPHAIERMAEPILRNDADFVYAAAGVVDEEGRLIGAMIPGPPESLILDNRVGGCFLYTREVYEKTGDYDPNFRLAEDYDYWVRVSKRFRMAPMDEDLYLYRLHPGNLTAEHGERRVREVVDRVRALRYSRARLDAADGLRAFHRGDRPTARRLLARALLRRPHDFSLYRPAAIVMAPEWLVGLVVKLKKRLTH
jgi:glycosyltransferase involved in cell wall biosynthesis